MGASHHHKSKYLQTSPLALKSRSLCLSATANNDNNDSLKHNDTEAEDGDTNTINGMLLLPQVGESSADESVRSKKLNNGIENKEESPESSKSVPVAFVGSGKFELQYTCKVCNTRNSNQVSRLGKFDRRNYQKESQIQTTKMISLSTKLCNLLFCYLRRFVAYRKGVVIAVCKGCKSKHLIADNLGWSDYIGGFEGESNIEEYLENNGRGDDVSRVNPTVWELENQLEKYNGNDDCLLSVEEENTFE